MGKSIARVAIQLEFADYTLTAEPRGEAYQELVQFAVDLGGQFGLVIRDSEPEGELPGDLRDIAHHLIADQHVSKWPGTELLGHRARRFKFSLTDDAASCLCRTADALFDWQCPLPEDLHFFDEAGRWWLGSIAHERDGFMRLDSAKAIEIGLKIPKLQFERS